MPAVFATAPGKVILFGEHAVVYGRPAIAVPLQQVRAKAIFTAHPRGEPGIVQIEAPAIGLKTALHQLPASHPLGTALRLGLEALGRPVPPAFHLRISSNIPVASGLGSGAAVSVAVLRGLGSFLRGAALPDEVINELAYAVEKLHHGTPSGIDNTVITYARPVYFVRGQPMRTFAIPTPFTLVIADTGVRSSTAAAVGAVRAAWKANPARYEALFDQVGALVQQAYEAIQAGDPAELGPLMNANQALLEEIGVSSPELERLALAARAAGAVGAKLSGAGRGGNLIALVEDRQAEEVRQALLAAGATQTLVSSVGGGAGFDL